MTNVQTITTAEMADILDRPDPIVINVLDREHYERVRISGTRNVPIREDDFVERVRDMVDDENDTVVLYCAGPECDASPRAAEKLADAGFTDVRDYEGGMAEWIASGRDIERPEHAAIH